MKKYIVILCLTILNNNLIAQNVGIGTSTPAPSAMLEVNSSTKGTLITRMNSSQRKAISDPATGLLVFDTDKNTIYLYDGINWLPMLFARNENDLPPFAATGSDATSGDKLGVSVALRGDYAIVGASHATVNGINYRGYACIFYRNNGVWQQQQKIIASDGGEFDYFGFSVAIENNYAVVGAFTDSHGAGSLNHEGSAYVFVRNGTTWTQMAKLIANDPENASQFGYSVSISGNYITIGAPRKDIGVNVDQGAVYIYSLINNTWTYQTRISHLSGGGGDYFGWSVQIDGSKLIAGAPYDNVGTNADQGSAYIFSRTGNLWSLIVSLAGNNGQANEHFGYSVSINGNYAIVGAPDRQNNSQLYASGAAYIFSYTNNTWIERIRISPEDGETGSWLGCSVGIYGDIAIVGARGYHTPDFEGQQGRAWVYKRNNNDWVLQRRIDDPNGQMLGNMAFSLAINGFNVVLGAPGKNSNTGEILFINVE